MTLSYNLKHSIFSISLNALGAGLAFSLQYIIIQLVGIAKYGNYAHINAFLIILSTLSVFGLNNYAIRTFADKHLGNLEAVIVAKMVGFVLFTSLSVLFLVTPVAYISGWSGSIPFIVIGFVFVGRNLLTLFSSILQSKGNTICSRFVFPVGPSFLAVMVLAGVWLAGLQLNNDFHSLWLIICVSNWVVLFLLLARQKWIQLRGVITHPNKFLKWGVTNGKYFFLANSSAILQQRLPVILCGLMLMDTVTGALNLILQLSTMALLVMSASNQVLAPRLAEFYRNQSDNKFFETVKFSILVGVLTAAVFFVFVVSSGDWLLRLFSEDIPLEAHTSLIVLAGGQLINATTGPIGFALAMADREKIVASVEWISALILVPILAFVIPSFGLIGTCCAISFIIVFRNLCLTALAYQKMRFHTSIFVLYKHPTMIKP